MSIALQPNRFETGEMLDVDRINGDLLGIARDVNRNLSQRYTYSQHTVDLTGMLQTDTAEQRTYRIRRAAVVGKGVQIIGVELVIYSAAGVTWTLSSGTTPSWPSISVATAGVTVEAYASSGVLLDVPSGASDTTLVLTGSAASTITRGYLVIHTRCDRGSANAAFVKYEPNLLGSATPITGAYLDTELTSAAVSVTADSGSDLDLRPEVFLIRNVSGTSTFRVPAGARRCTAAARAEAYISSAGICTTTLAGAGLSGILSSINIGGGAGTIVVNLMSPDGSLSDLPLTAANDFTCTFSSGGTVIALCYVIVWWT